MSAPIFRTAGILGWCAAVALGCEGGSGPAGATGPQGATGLAGTNGGTGATGDKGEQGSKGAAGDPGTNGQDGKNGANGRNGQDGKNGLDGAAGAPGAKGDKGDPGQTLVGTGTINGTVTAVATGMPVATAVVTTLPLGTTATTTTTGSFVLKDLAIGAYVLSVAAPGYTTQQVPAVGVVTNATTNVAVALLAPGVPGAAPVVVVGDQTWVGYAKPVTLAAAATDADTAAGKLTYQWTQILGPKVALAGDSTPNLAFTTKSLADHKPQPLTRFDALGLSGDEAGRYLFQLAVSDGDGHTTKTTATVTCTEPTSGLRTLPLGVPAYFSAPLTKDAAPYKWTLDTTGAVGSKAALADDTTATPHFTPDVKGIYKLTETASAQMMTLYGGSWVGITNNFGACGNCHNDSFAPDVFTPWLKTAHAQAAQRKFDGEVGPFGPQCLKCHTLGSSQANNGGFDDVQKTANWSFSGGKAGTWDALQKDQPALGQLAGIQCESCHGPQSSPAHGNNPKLDVAARVSWSAAVCATCHQSGPTYAKPSQWQASGHSNLQRALDEATFEKRGTTAAHCGRCHSAQGHALYVKQLQAGNAGVLVQPDGKAADESFLRGLGLQTSTVQPPTCVACHDPHGGDHPAQLRLHDKIAVLPNGLAGIAGVGAGAACMACHNTRNGEHTDFASPAPSFTAPHAPSQTDVLYGFNAYFMPRFTPSGHLAIKDTCATCHVALSGDGQTQEQVPSNHSFKPGEGLCGKCHAEQVNGKGLQAALMMEHQLLGTAIGNKVAAAIQAANGPDAVVSVVAWNPDPNHDVYSTTVALPATSTVTGVDVTAIHGQIGFVLHLQVALTATWTDKTLPPATLKDVYVRAGDLKVAVGAATAVTVIDPKSDLVKALWNWSLVNTDGSKGIHNPSFYKALLSATAAKVNAL